MSDLSKLIQPDDVEGKPYIFVSYSRADEDLVQKVLRILKGNGFRFWYDRGLKSGREWSDELGDKIVNCEQFMVLISSNSIRSKYVIKETRLAVDTEKDVLAVYLEEVEKLPNGLRLLIGDIQSIHRADFSVEGDFETAICEGAAKSTLWQEETPQFGLHGYHILYEAGRGGASTVFAAKQERSGIKVAVKRSRSIDPFSTDASFWNRFFQEEKEILAELARRACPFVPVILDWFQDGHHIYLIESFIEGQNLSQDYDHDYSEEEVVSIAVKILGILQRIHKAGILYGDVKPGNIIRNEYGDVYLVDFNSSKKLGNDSTYQNIWGTMTVTRRFSPPEQSDRKGFLDYSSDIYALGQTLEFLLCRCCSDQNRSFSVRYYRRDVSVELEVILRKMTDPDREYRYRNAEETLKALENYRRTHILNKLRYTFQSRKRIREYGRLLAEEKERQNQALRNFAADSCFHTSKENRNTCDDENTTEIISDSDVSE